MPYVSPPQQKLAFVLPAKAVVSPKAEQYKPTASVPSTAQTYARAYLGS